MSAIDDRLKALGIVLPEPVAPVANYVPYVLTGNQLYISGQISIDASGGIKGVVGQEVDADTAKAAARLWVDRALRAGHPEAANVLHQLFP